MYTINILRNVVLYKLYTRYWSLSKLFAGREVFCFYPGFKTLLLKVGVASTYTDSKGKVHSRINPVLTMGAFVTDTRSAIQYVAIEYGMVNLKGQSVWQRAEKLISIAHPDFRDELTREAEKLKLLR